MASSKQGAPVVSKVLEPLAPRGAQDSARFLASLNRELRATVHRVDRLTPKIVEVIVHAPMAARQFRPGQFYRLQNFESLAAKPEGTRLAMEGIALTGAWVDREKGLVSTIVLEMGGSSDLCALLKPGEPVILMGPTGTPTETPSGETVVLVGGGLGNAVLFSIGAATRAAGSRVLYFAGYKKIVDRYKVAEIEAAADEVVWCCDEGPGFAPARAADKAFVGNIVEAMAAHACGALGAPSIRIQDADRIVAIGSDGMMAAVARARHGILAPYLKETHVGIGSINSPMQCMMKEICAQCLQPHVDPATGKTTYVFSCFNQDQPLDLVNFGSLRERLRQNSLQEKLTAQWIDRALVVEGARPAKHERRHPSRAAARRAALARALRRLHALLRARARRWIAKHAWSRIHDPKSPVYAAVAEVDGRVVGIINYLLHESTGSFQPVCYLQDSSSIPTCAARAWESSSSTGCGRDEGASLVAPLLEHARDELPRPRALRPVHAAQRLPSLRHHQSRSVSTRKRRTRSRVRRRLDQLVGTDYDAPHLRGFSAWIRARWMKWVARRVVRHWRDAGDRLHDREPSPAENDSGAGEESRSGADHPRALMLRWRAISANSMYANAQIGTPHRVQWRCAGHLRPIGGKNMSLGLILLIIVILVLVGVLPTWPHSRSWGRGPSGILGVIVLVVLVLFLMGKI
jgi:NAD(P)H-flavin reductase